MVWYWERLSFTGLGALAMADMGEGHGSTGSPTARDDTMEDIEVRFGTGNASTRLGWARWPGRHPGCACKGQTKGLSLTERRLSFAFAEGTPRPEAQVLRLTVRGD